MSVESGQTSHFCFWAMAILLLLVLFWYLQQELHPPFLDQILHHFPGRHMIGIILQLRRISTGMAAKLLAEVVDLLFLRRVRVTQPSGKRGIEAPKSSWEGHVASGTALIASAQSIEERDLDDSCSSQHCCLGFAVVVVWSYL